MRVDVPRLKTALYFIFQNLPNSKCFLHVLAEGLCEAHAKKTISRSLEHLRGQQKNNLVKRRDESN